MNLQAGARIVDEQAADAFIETGKAERTSGKPAERPKHRTTILLDRELHRAVLHHCADQDPHLSLTTFIETAVREKLERLQKKRG